jgi:capsule polysaccharide export protein KpsE/RkpR
VVYDRQGRPETVRYHLLVPLLLAELQREEAALRQVQEQGRAQEERMRALLARIGALERELRAAG